MGKKPTSKISKKLATPNECLESARKFKTKRDWNAAEPKMVDNARRLGKNFYEQCVAHTPKHAKHNLGVSLADSLQYLQSSTLAKAA